MIRFALVCSLALVAGQSFGQVATYNGRQYTPENYPRGVSYKYPNCGMCCNIRDQWRSQGWVSGSGKNKVMQQTLVSTAAAPPKSEATPAKSKATETKYRTVTKYKNQMFQVRRCINGRCTIVNEWRQVPYQVQEAYEVPVEMKAEAEAKPEPKPDPEPKIPVSTDISDMPDGTPQIAVDAMLAVLGLDEGDTLWDIGSGRDARFLLTACQRYGCKGIGIEINEKHAASSRKLIEESGLSDRITIITADALGQSYGAARKVVMYQYDDVQDAVIAKLAPGTLVGCYMHEPAGIETRPYRVGAHPFHVGVK